MISPISKTLHSHCRVFYVKHCLICHLLRPFICYIKRTLCLCKVQTFDLRPGYSKRFLKRPGACTNYVTRTMPAILESVFVKSYYHFSELHLQGFCMKETCSCN